jgi:hypothetical protein
MRIVLPAVFSTGFGNNVFALAKAHVIAEACGLRYQPPVWPPCEHVRPPTPNGYGYYFPSSLKDRVQCAAIEAMFRLQRRFGRALVPAVDFDKPEYEALGIEDIGDACAEFLRQRGLGGGSRPVLVKVGGMWGRYRSIRRAREWVGELLRSHAPTQRRLERIEARLAGRPCVAVNIRCGDFVPRQQAGAIQGGERVVRLDLDWYGRICRQLREVHDTAVVLITDGTRSELASFLDEFDPVHCIGEDYNDLLGVLLMVRSDLVVCSNSTYSRLGVFLNDRPYVWCAETLVKDASGAFGYLFKELGPPPRRPATGDASLVRRCFAMGHDTRRIPEGLRRYWASGAAAPIAVADDLIYDEPVELLDSDEPAARARAGVAA